MFRFAVSDWFVAASLIAACLVPATVASGAVESGRNQELAEASATVILAGSADMELRFIQEDGPDSGHVRVVLTPETRPLTVFEARSAAQQGFLEALNDDGLGDNLSRITVEVRLTPKSHPRSGGADLVLRFLHKGGRDWTILPGE